MYNVLSYERHIQKGVADAELKDRIASITAVFQY